MAKKIVETRQNFDWFWERLDRYLSSQDLKQTKQRRIVIKSFLENGGHVDAEMLYRKLKRDHKNIGLATIYRTLNLLKAANLAIQHSFADGRALFEPLIPDDHHDHLVCLECQKVVEFKSEGIESLQESVAAELGFVLADHRLDLFGYCKDSSCPTRPIGR